jgi:hypothetical protein
MVYLKFKEKGLGFQNITQTRFVLATLWTNVLKNQISSGHWEHSARSTLPCPCSASACILVVV